MSRITEKIILVITDLAAVNISFFLVYIFQYYRSGDLSMPAVNILQAIGALSLAWLIILPLFDLYRTKFIVSRTDEIIGIFKAVTFGTVILYILISYDTGEVLQKTRIYIFSYWILLFFNIGICRIIIRTYQRKLLRRGVGHKKMLIIGTGKRAFEIYNKIINRPYTGLTVAGFIEITLMKESVVPNDLIIGDMDSYKDFCSKNKIEDVLIVLDRPSKKKIFEIIDKCDEYPVSLKTVPDIYEIAIGNPRIQNYDGLQFVNILPENVSFGFRIAKRIIDVAISALTIFMFMPLWVLIGIAIKLSSRGPVFFRQKRIGKNGQTFIIFKFRAMYYKNEEAERATSINDPRITGVGHILRKYRLDEIPQLINVLEGDMSLIGPRPEMPVLVNKYIKQIPLYSKRFRIKPGISGWAQVKQRFEDSVTKIPKKVEYDLYYLENMSLLLDLKIIAATIFTVLARRGG